MNAPDLLEAVQNAGGSLRLNGRRIQYALPDSAVWLLTELKQNRDDLVALLREREDPPPMPPGVRLLKWLPKSPPLAIVRMGIVSNVHEFIAATLLQLRARLECKDFLAGRGPLRELVDRLEQVGVEVCVESAQSSDLQPK
jgi:hypothetical protein